MTSSPRVADLLHSSQRDDLSPFLTGGVRTPSDALAGTKARRTVRCGVETATVLVLT